MHGFGKPPKIEEVPTLTPGPGELLIKVIANGVGHTDLHAACHKVKLEHINRVFDDMKAGKIDGRMVMTSF